MHAVGRFEVAGAGLPSEVGRGLYKRLDSARCQLTLVPSMGKGGLRSQESSQRENLGMERMSYVVLHVSERH